MSVPRKVYVNVRLVDGAYDWIEVLATSLGEAIEIAKLQSSVDAVLEASWIPGGVVT